MYPRGLDPGASGPASVAGGCQLSGFRPVFKWKTNEKVKRKQRFGSDATSRAMINKVALTAFALAGSQVVWSQAAAANEIFSPHSGAVRLARASQPDKPAVSAEEDKFLSLLEKNVASGGPPKDGIPAVDRPQYTSAGEADKWLVSEDIVFGVDYKGLVAAYPQRILVWHEIANDTIGHEKISVTYCPLTGTAIGYKGTVTPATFSTFGVSGKLVNSNLIMYDRSTDSRWPQILGKAITGSLRGSRLEEFPVVWTTWEKWKRKHPNTKVLSQKTGFIRDYGKNGDPYGSYLDKNKGYYDSERLIFNPIVEDRQLHPKHVVIGVRDETGNAAAIVKDRLRQEKKMDVKLGGKSVVLTYDPALDSYSAAVKDTGEWINAFDAMWFAWKAFYSSTQLLK